MTRHLQKRFSSLTVQSLCFFALVCAAPAQAETQADRNLAVGNMSENAIEAPEIGQWFRDEHGCKVWGTTPLAGKRLNWSGSCVDGYAEGDGVVVWYSYDYGWVGPSTQRRKMFSKTFERKDSGNFVHGKLIGRGTQLWADGMRFKGDFVGGQQTNTGVYSWNRDDVVRAKEVAKPLIKELGTIPEYYGCKAVYPHESLLAEEQGVTRIIFAIDARGKLLSARVAESSGFLRLDKASILGLIECWPVTVVPQKAREVVSDYVWSLP